MGIEGRTAETTFFCCQLVKLSTLSLPLSFSTTLSSTARGTISNTTMMSNGESTLKPWGGGIWEPFPARRSPERKYTPKYPTCSFFLLRKAVLGGSSWRQRLLGADREDLDVFEKGNYKSRQLSWFRRFWLRGAAHQWVPPWWNRTTFPTNFAKWYTCHLMMVSYHDGNKLAEGKTLPTPRHSLNAFSEPRPSRTLEADWYRWNLFRAVCHFNLCLDKKMGHWLGPACWKVCHRKEKSNWQISCIEIVTFKWLHPYRTTKQLC